MNNCVIWANRLYILLENNFLVARYYKKYAECTEDTYLKNYFQKQASRRSQFAFELHREINYLSCSSNSLRPIFSPHAPVSQEENNVQVIKKCIEADKESWRQYKKALSAVNNGSSREILIRHKSRIEATIEELKRLKSENKVHGEKQNVLRKIK